MDCNPARAIRYACRINHTVRPVLKIKEIIMNNVKSLQAAHAAFSAHDLVAATDDMRDDVVFYSHAAGVTLDSAAAFREFMGMYYAMSSDIRIIDAEYIAAGDKVVAQFHAVGVNDGPFLGFPATGREFSLDVAEVWRFDDQGRLAEGHNYADSLGLLIQFGHIAVPA